MLVYHFIANYPGGFIWRVIMWSRNVMYRMRFITRTNCCHYKNNVVYLPKAKFVLKRP